MSGLRRIGIALLGAMLVGCGTDPAQMVPEKRPASVITAMRAPAHVAPIPRHRPKNLKKDDFSVPRETSPAARPSPSDPDYRAIGTEPFWAVTVQGRQATLERPGTPALIFTVAPDADGYRGEGLSIMVTAGPCSDGMSYALWSDRVAIAFGEGVLKGCGGAREDEGARAP